MPVIEQRERIVAVARDVSRLRAVRSGSRSCASSYRDLVQAGLVIGGKYHVVQLIAHGGMGAVYDAIDAKTGRRVALKLMNERALAAGPVSLRRFEREARAAAAIDSLHVVQVLDAGEDDTSGMPFIVMEHLEGEDLRSLLARRRPLPAEEAIAIATQVCLGLVKAHGADIIHRDLKPANLFLTRTDDGRPLVKILDFGVAKLLDETESGRVTKTGDVVGSPSYMSPEQLTSPRAVDHRSDVWSLGVVLYEMVSGGVPTADIDALAGRVHAICHVPARSLAARVPGIQPELVALVQRALALAPSARFSSAAEMLRALRRVKPNRIERRGVGVTRRAAGISPVPDLGAAKPAPEVARPASPKRAQRLVMSAAACVGALALAVAVGRGLRSSGTPPSVVDGLAAAEEPLAIPEEALAMPEELPATPAPAPSSDDTKALTPPSSGVTPGTKSVPSPRTPSDRAHKLAGRPRAKTAETTAPPRTISSAPKRGQL